MSSLSPGLFLRTALVLLTTVVAQVSVLAWFSIDLLWFGPDTVHADALVAVAVAAGVVGGAQRGAVTGFVAGLLLDLLLFTPFGLSALTYALIGYAVGLASSLRVRQSRVFTPAAGFLGGAAGVLLFALLGELVGQPLLSDPDLVAFAVVEAVTTAVLAVPAAAALRWAWRPEPKAGAVLL